MKYEINYISPFKKKKEKLGKFNADQVTAEFNKISWDNLSKQLSERGASEYDSPSFGVENIDNKLGLILAPINNEGWLIYFKAEENQKYFFNLFSRRKMVVKEKRNQEIDIARKCLSAFIEEDYNFLIKLCDKIAIQYN